MSYAFTSSAGGGYLSLGIQRSYYPSPRHDVAPYTGPGPVDPVGVELDAIGRIPLGPPLDLRR